MLQNLFDQAKINYEMLISTGSAGFREKALKFYREYKAAGGKKTIKGLED